MKKCNVCGKKVEKLDQFRSLEACEICCNQAIDDERDFRSREYDAHIDLQREMSEGCLDDFNY